MEVTYTAENYHPTKVRARYVRVNHRGHCVWCEVGDDTRHDLRRGTVEAEELPDDIMVAADKLRGTFPTYTKWPITD